MAKKKPKSLLQMQKEKLAAQKKAKAAKVKKVIGAKNTRIANEGVARMATNQLPKTQGEKARIKRKTNNTGRSGRARKERLDRAAKKNQPGARRREAQRRLDQAKQNQRAASSKPKTPATTPRGRASAKRAQAAAKLERARQGTTSPGVRTGQPKGSANRMYGADRVNAAVSRAKGTVGLGRVANVVGPAAAQQAGLHLASKLAETIGKPGQSRMSRLGLQGPAKGSAEPKSAKPTTAKRTGNKVTGQADYTKQQQRLSDARSKYPKSAPKVSAPKTKTKPSASAPKPTRKPIPKPAEKKSAAHTYKEHGSNLHVGRYKTLKEHRAAVAARKKKQK